MRGNPCLLPRAALRLAHRESEDFVFFSVEPFALPGIFDARSWACWHARLGMEPAPPRPVREFIR